MRGWPIDIDEELYSSGTDDECRIVHGNSNTQAVYALPNDSEGHGRVVSENDIVYTDASETMNAFYAYSKDDVLAVVNKIKVTDAPICTINQTMGGPMNNNGCDDCDLQFCDQHDRYDNSDFSDKKTLRSWHNIWL